MLKRALACTAGILIVGSCLCTALPANAQVGLNLQFNGGRWSRHFHPGWNRYYGGPSIGFYYAPSPVYVDPTYPYAQYPNYYAGPVAGISLGFGGGGGHWHRHHRHHHHHHWHR
jgi:hypothetical protein